jgi:hypothetical protein
LWGMGQQVGNTTHGTSGRITGSRGLTVQQAAFVAAMVANGGDQALAAKAAGYKHRTSAWVVSQVPAVQAALHDARQKKLSNLATAGIGFLEQVVRGQIECTVRERLDAVKIVLPLAGHVAPKAGDAEARDAKSLEDMDINELQSFVSDMMAKRAAAAKPVIDGQAVPDSAPDSETDETDSDESTV